MLPRSASILKAFKCNAVLQLSRDFTPRPYRRIQKLKTVNSYDIRTFGEEHDAERIREIFNKNKPCFSTLDLTVGTSMFQESCLMADRGNSTVGSCLLFPAANGLWHLSSLHVDRDERHNGLGSMLLQTALDSFTGKDDRVFTFAYEGTSGFLRNFNFHETYPVGMYSRKIPDHWSIDRSLSLAEVVPSEHLVGYDKRVFLINLCPSRRTFLTTMLKCTETKSLVALEDDEVVGFAMIRPAQLPGRHIIGPLYADDFAIAEKLFKGICSYYPGQTVFTTTRMRTQILENFVAPLQLIKEQERMRMYRGEAYHPSDVLISIASAEVLGT